MLCVLLVQWDTHHLGLQDYLIVGGGCSKSQCNGLIFGGREGGREREREMGNGKWEMARIIGISMGYSCHTLVCCWIDLNRGAIRRTGRILTRPNPFVHGMILQLAAWEKQLYFWQTRQIALRLAVASNSWKKRPNLVPSPVVLDTHTEHECTAVSLSTGIG